MKVVLIRCRDDECREFPLTAEKTVLGRHQECALRVPTRDVSRNHCEVVLSGDRVLVRDLGSTNGTYVNGKRVAEAVLEPGDQLSIGPVVFVVQIDGKPAEVKSADIQQIAAMPAGASGDDEDTEQILDLDDLELDLEDPMSAVEAILDEQDEDDDDDDV